MPRSYAYSAGLTWPDYLKVNEIRDVGEDVRNVRYEVTSANKELIATNEQLTQVVSREIQDAAAEICSSIDSGFYEISDQLQGLQDTVSDLRDIIWFGFKNLTEAVDRLNDSIIELIKIARTPAQTWAYNQFEIAREGYRKRLYPEALEALDQAISGRGDNPGYQLEYRFHFLKGDILLGSAKSLDLSVVDAAAAEESFLNAARYASNEFPQEAAKAFVAAAFAAYVQGKMAESIEYCKKGIALESSIGEGWFQLAKVYIHSGNVNEAMQNLKSAIDINREYVFKAESDDDFISFSPSICNLYNDIVGEKKAIFHQRFEKFYDKLNTLESWWDDNEKVTDVNRIKSMVQNAIDENETSTIIGVYNAIEIIKKADITCDIILNNRKKELLNELKQLYANSIEYIDNTRKIGQFYNKRLYSDNVEKFNEYSRTISIPKPFNNYKMQKAELINSFKKIESLINGNLSKSKIIYLFKLIFGAIGLCMPFGFVGYFVGTLLGYVVHFISSMFVAGSKGLVVGNAYLGNTNYIDPTRFYTGLVCGLICFIFAFFVLYVNLTEEKSKRIK